MIDTYRGVPKQCPSCEKYMYLAELHLGQEVLHCSECGSIIGEPTESLEDEPFAIHKRGRIVCNDSERYICGVEWMTNE